MNDQNQTQKEHQQYAAHTHTITHTYIYLYVCVCVCKSTRVFRVLDSWPSGHANINRLYRPLLTTTAEHIYSHTCECEWACVCGGVVGGNVCACIGA